MSWPAEPGTLRLRMALLWGAVCVSAPVAANAASRWEFPVSTGYDLYIHDYFLSETDTTEVIQEFNVAASVNGTSAWGAQNRWYLRAGGSGGTELFRQTLDAGFRLRNDDRHEWLRGDLLALARQFREDSEYSLSSNNVEGRALLATSPWAGEHAGVELRVRGRFVEYADPSTLEVSYRDGAAGAYLRSPDGSFRNWNVGGLITARDYADSAEINRRGFTIEGDYDHGALEGEFRAFHRTERRNIEDETARPSAWFHWTDVASAIPVDPGEVILRASSEVWDYDEPIGAWYDSWLLGGQVGGRWGDPLRARYELLLAAEHLTAGDEPETYTQAGVRFGAESVAGRFSGSASIEIGHRWYQDMADTGDDFVLDYSDYAYLALWLMANWQISDHFSTDLALNYEPENHTEQDDNMTLGFASLRLVWRP